MALANITTDCTNAIDYYGILMYLSMVCPRVGGGGGNPGKLTFKLALWEGILTVKYLLICTNYKGLYGNLTSGEHPGKGNLRFSSQKSQIPWGLPPPNPHPGANH